MTLTEAQLRKTIKEMVRKALTEEELKRITDGSEKAVDTEMDVPAFYINRDIEQLVTKIDSVAEKYRKGYRKTKAKMFKIFGSKLLSLSKELSNFMQEQGYDSYLRKREGID